MFSTSSWRDGSSRLTHRSLIATGRATVVRSLALTVITALVGSLLIVGTAPAQASDRLAIQPKPAKQANAWLTRQLTSGLVFNDQYSFNDYGLTLDVGFAKAALGDRTRVAVIRTAMAAHAAGYTTGVESGNTDIYAGPTAKLAVFAQISGAKAKNYGGVNLIKQLAGRVSATAPIKGRIQDQSGWGDYANTIGQAYTVRALNKAGHPKAAPALKFLLKQQCQAGYFRLDFAANKTSTAQSCDPTAKTTTSAPDTDATALAVISLSALKSPSKKVRTSIARATRWLVRHQQANGSFGGGISTAASNSNSTGVASWALSTVGKCTQARHAARWLKKLQVRATTDPFVTGAKGAIAYDRTALSAAQSAGSLAVEVKDQWRRASSQAAPALLNLRLGSCTNR